MPGLKDIFRGVGVNAVRGGLKKQDGFQRQIVLRAVFVEDHICALACLGYILLDFLDRTVHLPAPDYHLIFRQSGLHLNSDFQVLASPVSSLGHYNPLEWVCKEVSPNRQKTGGKMQKTGGKRKNCFQLSGGTASSDVFCSVLRIETA